MKKFKLNSPYKPLCDQPKAINSLVDGINKGEKEQTLLGDVYKRQILMVFFTPELLMLMVWLVWLLI